MNNDNSIDDEIRKFHVDGLDIKYRCAKEILLSDDIIETNNIAVKLLEELDDDDFINALTWPLMKSFERLEVYENYCRERLYEIFSTEIGGEQIEKEYKEIGQ